MNKNVLVVAAHADDEVLGCGGAIARHVHDGDNVQVIFMADGVSSRKGEKSDHNIKRNQARDEALRILGVSGYIALDLPDNRMDSMPLLDIVQAIEPLVREIQPVRIYTHHQGDLNVDHRITHQAVLTACRPIPGACVREILCFEVMSSTEWAFPGLADFIPNAFIDIGGFLQVKMDALASYALEMHQPPHSRSLEHIKILAAHRGMSVGVDAAEAFALARAIW
jgi:LmbE family N-acetylglucosaminyl deacetylase